MLKRVVGFSLGLSYDVVLVISLLVIDSDRPWHIFFFFTSFLGTLYPGIGLLVVDLKSPISKAAFVALFAVHIFLAASFFLSNELFAAPGRNRMLEYSFSSVVFFALAVIPQSLCIIYFIHHIVRNGFFDRGDEQSKLGIFSR